MVSALRTDVASPPWLAWWGGAALGGVLGAAMMALVDPVSGRQRRARLSAAGRALWSAREAAGAGAGDAIDAGCARCNGAQAAAQSEQKRLLARVRRQLGRLCEDGHAIEVRLAAGVLELHGQVRRTEQRRVVQGVCRIYGVGEVRSFLHAYDRHSHGEDGRVVH